MELPAGLGVAADQSRQDGAVALVQQGRAASVWMYYFVEAWLPWGDQNFDIRHKNEQNGGDGWLKLNEKRVREAWFTYALIELRQRYQLTGDIATNIETAMEENQYVLQDVFRQRWSTHRCNIDGCGSVIVIGNL